MKPLEPLAVDPSPPGSKPRYEWSGFPWWFLGIIGTIAYPLFKILTDEVWNDGFQFIKDGMTLTLIVTSGGFVLAMVLGLVVSLGRMSKNVFSRNLAIFYIEIVRGIPVLVTILFIGIVVWPELMSALNVAPRTGLSSNAVKATVAVGMVYAAFIAEVFRAGVQSVAVGQREAGMSVGLSRVQVFRTIVWPQAIKNILPALGNDLVALLKDSSLVSILAVRELTQMTKLWTGGNFQFVAGYLILAAFYLLLTVSLSILLQWYERKIGTP
jgi:polar amino acid transport system permease protein